jgi:Multicopper oxidase
MHIGANIGEIVVAARYGPNLGEFMVHCHNNVHEDYEMMRAYLVSLTCAVMGAHHSILPEGGCGASVCYIHKFIA